MWQKLREELYPQGLEIVTVALDTAGAEAARPFIEAAKPTHPSLLDQAHLLDELFGISNVPSGVWINEEGQIVRPPETAFPARPFFLDRQLPPDASPALITRLNLSKQIPVEPDKYVTALRDWVSKGENSRYALSADEVIERSRPRPLEEAQAAAYFELGQYLYREGRVAEAIIQFRQAHRLQPNNWTYKRQAWSLHDPSQGPNSVYEGDWVSDVQKIGVENYYEKLKMD